MERKAVKANERLEILTYPDAASLARRTFFMSTSDLLKHDATSTAGATNDIQKIAQMLPAQNPVANSNALILICKF